MEYSLNEKFDNFYVNKTNIETVIKIINASTSSFLLKFRKIFKIISISFKIVYYLKLQIL
jgi:hypothetical protein